jgi:hypothetical protein
MKERGWGIQGSDRVVLTAYLKEENMKKTLCDIDHIYWYLSATILFHTEAELMKVQFLIGFWA